MKKNSTSKIRIGVDARLLSEPLTGIGRYFYEILSRLVESDYEWYLYSHRPIIIGDWNRNNVVLKTLNLNGRILRMLWAQSILPYWCCRDSISLFWGPSHRVPRFLPASISSIVTIHDLVWRHAGWTMRPLSRFLDSKFMLEAVTISNAVIAVSASTAKDLTDELPMCSEKISVIHHGASSFRSKALPGSAFDNSTSKPYYLFVGTIEPRKNLARLLEAISLMPKSVRESADLIITGGKGWGGVDVRKLIFKYDISQNIQIKGYVGDDVLGNLYKNAIFLVMPSLYEGFGLPIIEALSYGIPVLTSNCSSMPEVAGDAAILVNPEDSKSISKGLEMMIINKDFRNNLASKAKKQASRFDWDVASKKTLTVIDNLISKKIPNSIKY
jgi:glycosyltransferase involved in cell wall biosynthesis